MSDVQPEHEIVAASRQVLAKVRSTCASWRFPSDLNQALAAAGSARSADLLGEALLLAERPPSVGANILVRSAFESWIAGTWALFGGDDAVLEFEAERARHERNLAAAMSLEEAVEFLEHQLQEIREASQELLGLDKPSSVGFEQMAKALPPLIKAQTSEHETADVLAIYNLVYRSHSTFDAHPWKILGQYIAGGGSETRIERPSSWSDPIVTSAVMSMYVGVLGRWIEEARGGRGDEWDEAVDGIRKLLDGSADSGPPLSLDPS